jgi:hypothetical protein
MKAPDFLGEFDKQGIQVAAQGFHVVRCNGNILRRQIKQTPDLPPGNESRYNVSFGLFSGGSKWVGNG